MKMASLFKDFITTYNRTYETEEGEDPARGPNQIRPSPLWPLGVGRGRTGEGVHPFRNSEVPKFLPSCPGLGGYLRDLTHSHLIFLVRNHGPPSFWGEWDGTKDRFSPLEAPGMMAFPVTSCLGALWGPFGFCLHTWDVITPVWPQKFINLPVVSLAGLPPTLPRSRLCPS